MAKRGKYLRIKINGKRIKEHKHVWQAVHGPIPEGFELHHINEDPKDNRIENLQLLTRLQHMKIHNMHPVVEGQKFCKFCLTSKMVAEFRIHQGYPYYKCKECDRKRGHKKVKHLTPPQKRAHN